MWWGPASFCLERDRMSHLTLWQLLSTTAGWYWAQQFAVSFRLVRMSYMPVVTCKHTGWLLPTYSTVLIAGFTVQQFGNSAPWLRLGVVHCLPATLLIALAHQTVQWTWHEASILLGLLCFDSVVLVSAWVTMYRQALHMWEQLPPPAWEGAPRPRTRSSMSQEMASACIVASEIDLWVRCIRSALHPK